MKILSNVYDKRINSTNLLAESTFGEYLSFAQQILNNNEFQRKRVKTSKTVYSLLKEDLKQGCVIPPIVLAISNVEESDNLNDLLTYIQNHLNNVMILDGLQRTFTLSDAESEMRDKLNYSLFLNTSLRLEIYTHINKFGILYRMLTLNTGQTPMSLRHQLEMLYSDMINTNIDGVLLVKDTEGKADATQNEFVFQSVIDGFNSYLNRNELPIDREELLDNIKTLEKMSEDSGKKDIFNGYIKSYVDVFNVLRRITNDYEVTDDDLKDYAIMGNPFGKTVSKVFSTSQALTGFGAAVGKLKDVQKINGFEEVKEYAGELKKSYEMKTEYEWLLMLLSKLNVIRNTSKKIGNAQRMLFQYFFRELLNNGSDSFLNLDSAVNNAFDKYLSQVN